VWFVFWVGGFSGPPLGSGRYFPFRVVGERDSGSLRGRWGGAAPAPRDAWL